MGPRNSGCAATRARQSSGVLAAARQPRAPDTYTSLSLGDIGNLEGGGRREQIQCLPSRSPEKIRLGELGRERGRGEHRDGDCQPPFQRAPQQART